MSAWIKTEEHARMMRVLEAEVERLNAENQTWQNLATTDKRYRWAKNNPRRFYEICQETLMSNVDEDVAIDAAMKGEL